MGRLLRILLSVLCPILLCSASLTSRCKDPVIRKEWRTLTKREQLSYLSAVQCILKKPPITPKTVASGPESRFDDLVTTHILQTFSIHFVGHFLPWHRYFTATYESMLRNECSYTGAQPYWDWNLDVTPVNKFTRSPVFDPVFGFGGNGPFVNITPDQIPFDVPGRTGGGCISSGPFMNMTVRMGPGNDTSGNPRCLTRDFSPFYAGWYLGRNVTEVALAQENFGWFDRSIEGSTSFDASGLHGGGHYSVGGTLGIMGDLYNSPSDPIFYLHHANLDRVWWSWQAKNLPARLLDISGPINILDYSNTLGGNVTLSFPLSLGVNAPNVTIAEVMDIKSGALCYDYDKLYV